jgi:hypothetical protein
VVGSVTDWGANMVSAGKELDRLLPKCHIQVHCFMHLLNLSLKDFAKEPCLADLIAECKALVEFVTRHTATQAIYDEKRAELEGTALVKPVATRFGSNVGMLQSIHKNM